MASVSVDDVTGIRHDLHRDGYVVLPAVVSPELLTGLAGDLAAAYETSAKFRGGGSITGHLNCFPGRSARFVRDELERHGVIELAHALRPDKSNAMRATTNYNLPGSVAQHYHMDGLYIEDFLICNVAVVDTTVKNGAIDVLPGTNREFLPFWKYAAQRTYRLSTRIEMLQGDALLRKSTLWHRGMPNKTATPRPMMSVTFGENSAPAGDPFDGDIVFSPNWYSTNRLGVLRERTFVAAPATYSVYRFVKSVRGQRGYDHY